MDKIIQQLKEMRQIEPRADWVTSNRELLLSQIKAQSTKKPSSIFSYWYLVKLIFPMRFLHFIAKPVGVTIIAGLFIIITGVYSVNASKGSLPGDILYPIKLTSEKVQISLTFSQPEKTQLRIIYAEERVKEIEKVIRMETDLQKRQKKVNIAVNNLKTEMNNVARDLENVKNKTVNKKEEAQKTIESVKQIDAKIADISSKLEIHKEELNKEVVNIDALKTINDAVMTVKEIGVKATEVIVDKFNKGEVDLPVHEVKDSVDKKIQEAQLTLIKVQEQSKTAEAAWKEFESQISLKVESTPEMSVKIEKNLEIESSKQITPTTVSTTVTTALENKTPEVLGPVVISPANPAEAEKLLKEAQELANQGDLKAAIEKLKLINNVTSQVKAEVDARMIDLQKLLSEKSATIIVPSIKDSNISTNGAIIEPSTAKPAVETSPAAVTDSN